MRASFFRTLLEVALPLAVLLGAGRWLLGLFTRRRAVHVLTAGRQLRLAFWALLAVGTGLSVLPAVGLKGTGSSSVEWALAGGFLAVTLGLGGPALLLHLRYYAANAATELAFDPKQGVLQLTEPSGPGYYPLRDGWPVRATWVRCRWPSVFWRSYEYLHLTLVDGRPLLLTSLLLELEPVAIYLRYYNVPVTEKWQPWAWPSGVGTAPA